VADNVRRLRDIRRLTTAGLAERVSARGVPMLPTTVTKIEKKNRRVTVDELAALADALNVAPAALLLAPGSDPIAEVAAFAGQMLRGPYRLEVGADEHGVTDVTFHGRRRRRPGSRADVVAALRDVEGNGESA
jgi:transcriptional regulator with XRE-family HTH domain